MAHWQTCDKAKIILQCWHPNVSKDKLSKISEIMQNNYLTVIKHGLTIHSSFGPRRLNRFPVYPNYSYFAALKDLRFVVKALQSLSTRWEEMGMAIDVKDLDKIKKEYRRGMIRL